MTAIDGSPERDRDWVAPTRLRNFLLGDPLVDWLELYGAAAGFVPDRELPGYDERTDPARYAMERGAAFEAAVLRLLAERWTVSTMDQGEHRAGIDAAIAWTEEAIGRGVPIIAQGALRNPENRTFGYADLIVRADILEEMVPGTLGREEAAVEAPRAGGPWHYRVVEVKYSGLELDAQGHLFVAKKPHYAAQVWLYNEALARVQGYLAPASYVLGRSWKSWGKRGAGCLERLARVDQDALAYRKAGVSLATHTANALAWVRRLREEGADWCVLPEPTIPELWPNGDGAGWSAAIARIAAELDDLAMLPGVSPWRRTNVLATGLSRWRDPRVSPEVLGVANEYRARCDNALAVNRGPEAHLLPARIELVDDAWRTPAMVELFVDIETAGDMNDDLSRLPERGGQQLIFQIGCGRWEGDTWVFQQWTLDRLTLDDERRMIEAFIERVDGLRRDAGVGWDGVRLIHWHSYEKTQFDTAPNCARSRHGDPPWPPLPWYDVLAEVVEPAAVAVTGCFSQRLKPLGKAMHALGMIETTWGTDVSDGNAAEVGAWRCEEEAARTGGSMQDVDLMDAIKHYNEIDCRVMAEIVRWLRGNR